MTTIKVLTDTGTEEVRAYATSVPGLVYHKSIARKGWTISHVKSGNIVIRGIRCTNVKLAAAKLGELPIDWTLCRSKLRATCKRHVPTIRQIAWEFGT